jgi:quercetin dioxygenase-like cupin family protein
MNTAAANSRVGATSAKHYRWEELPPEQLKDGLTRRLIASDRMMIAHVYFKKGIEVPRHAHENEQITYILEGALKFHLGEKGEQELIVRAGEVLVIPSWLPHSAVALEDTLDVDVFNPPRQDWLAGTDAYLRG